ncbi:site-2 protease family protein [Micromonospora sp. DR5-3]|uniref:M50 family metallopeptidase n=1 Tax=unclassified Micromonospora TaxID=2617518 RepID=UPI0011DB6B65|nr:MULTISPECIES: site-2 protease family protein [unclassified Micromonospora]MCW3813504.1 site-2 protease family protein [Micromonospora sp. DR5-3]TYC24829.1 site-2 protease family protein [Micromonospora sp. MP36]
MAYLLGMVLFALAILISVSLHEAGHMLTAKAFGMKVTRYFVGFGPTLWSFKRGETEYGIKGIPLGGFCKIVGMTPQDDDVEPADQPRAMWRYPVWKRTIVMSAGSITHFALALVAIWLAAIFMGLPNPALQGKPLAAYVKVTDCVVTANEQRECKPGDPASPARQAGLRDNDRIVAVNGTAVPTYADLVKKIRELPVGPATITYERDGVTGETKADLAAVQRTPIDKPDAAPVTVSALGVAGPVPPPGVPLMVKYGPVDAIGETAHYTGDLAVGTFESMKRIPEKVPALWTAVTGGERDVDTPISVVGATRLGGEAVQHDAWELFVSLFIGLNFFIGVFNLLPLLPLDGGHIIIAWFERVRSWIFAGLGRPDPGRVDYLKLMPITYAVILIGGAFTLLTVTADIFNPITLFSR